MSTTELPRQEAEPATHVPDAVERAEPAGAPAGRSPDEFSDAEFARAFKLGALFGLPVIYLVVVAVSWLAAPGNVELLVVALWPTLFGGWYFGGVVALGVLERRRHRAESVAEPGA